MSRDEILKALALCTQTDPNEDCSNECPYIAVSGCIHQLLNDTFEMVKNREPIEAAYTVADA